MMPEIEILVDHLNEQVVKLLQQNAYDQGLKLATQAIELAQQYLGEKHPSYGYSLNNLAEIYRRMGRFAAAEPLYKQAVQIMQTAKGDSHPEVALLLNNWGLLYIAQGEYASARQLFEQSLIILHAQPEEPPSLAFTLNNLAQVYSRMGDYIKAEPLYVKSLEIRCLHYGESSPQVAVVLNNLGHINLAKAHYPQAQSFLEQALSILRVTKGEEHSDYASSLSLLAEYHWKLSNYAEAKRLTQLAHSIWQRTFGEEYPEAGSTLDNLATLAWNIGNYIEAENLFQRAGDMIRKMFGEFHPDLATHLNQVGLFYAETRNYKAAEKHYQQAHAIANAHDHKLLAATVLNNLGLLYRTQGDYAKALPFFQEVLEIRGKELVEEHPDVAQIIDNMLPIISFLNLEAAEQGLRQVLEIRRHIFGEHHPETAFSLNNLASHYQMNGEYEMAEPLFLQALESRRSSVGIEHTDYTQILSNLATLYAALERVEEAQQGIEESIIIQDRLMGKIFAIGTEVQRMNYLGALQENFHIYLSLVLQHLTNQPSAIRSAFDLVLRRKALGAEALAVQRDAVFSGRYPHLRAKLQELTTVRKQIAQKSLNGRGVDSIDVHQRLLAEWEVHKGQLEAELARQIPEMNMEQKLRATDLGMIANLLPPNTVLIEFVRFDEIDFQARLFKKESPIKPARYLAFVLPAGEPENLQMLDLGEAYPIDHMVATFRASITGGDRHLRPEKPVVEASDGTALRATLFDPLAAALSGRTRLFIAPDGDLTRLSFEALPLDGERRLIDDYQISYLSVGRDVQCFETVPNGQPGEPLIVADPDFDLASPLTSAIEINSSGRQSRDLARGTLEFTRLQGTRIEGKQIATLLGVKPWLESAALELHLKDRSSPRILHVATHGFFLSDQKHDVSIERMIVGSLDRLSLGLENPLLRSGLALAGANTWLAEQERNLPTEAEDGLLTAEDVTGMDLLSTELVVLSACDTGLGQVQVGEGVFGLRRAFVLAGAKTLVMSLWKVPDQQTQELMIDFYQRLLNGTPRAAALREAQLEMKQKYPDPLYWAAFICQGNPGPLLASGAAVQS